MFFFDLNPDLFQLQNCVIDLQTNSIRYGRPADMCSRASQIAILREWLADPRVTEDASRRYGTTAVVWSMFKRNGDFHPLDAYEEIGDQDTMNFHYLLMLMAKLLEGRPLCRLVVRMNARGRNSKGVLEKIFVSVWSTYYVSVRSTVFHSDRRNEHEHSAAELNRRGTRVAFASEVGPDPWSNGEFKRKNSSDPVSARGCGSKEVERIARTETFVYGMNDPLT